MAARQTLEASDMSIVDAVETLTSLADLDFEAEIGVTQQHGIVVADREISFKTVHWIHEGDRSQTLRAVREVFRTVLNYLRKFYKKRYGKVHDARALDGIEDIMLLVGEAAKKLDRYTELFKKSRVGSVTNLREFKQLEKFYRSKVAPHAEGDTREGILAMPGKKGAEDPVASNPGPALDLEEVKRDRRYELLMLRAPDGGHYYPSQLIRNMKLVCDFGDTYGAKAADDPLLRTPIWLDRCVHSMAEHVLRGVGRVMDEYIDLVRDEKLTELSSLLNKIMMALFLAANPRNLLRNRPVKSCTEYFADFQHYLRRALTCREYRKSLAYSGKSEDRRWSCMVDLCHAFCRAIYMRNQGHMELLPVLDVLFKQEARELGIKGLKKKHWIDRISVSHELIDSLTARHPHGPVRKLLDMLEAHKGEGFDPIMQENTPHQWLDLYMGDHRVRLTHMPTPTAQIRVNRCDVIPEFKGLLHSYRGSHMARKHLMFNLQDRTSWRELSRSEMLESFAQQKANRKTFAVVSLNKDTDFYHQSGVYREEDDAELFIQHFIESLRGENTGYRFPSEVQAELLGAFLDDMVKAVHEIFFRDKDLFDQVERQTFIELAYLFIQLKIIDLSNPDSVSFTCKDGIDVGCCASAQFYAFLQLINNRMWGNTEIEHMILISMGPSLMLRERAVQPERFERMMQVLRLTQARIDEKGYKAFAKLVNERFEPLYLTEVLGISADIPSLEPSDDK